MSKRHKILNDAIKFQEKVSNPSKNLASHMAMRKYASDFAEWCYVNGWDYIVAAMDWVQRGDLATKATTEDLLNKFDTE